MTIISTTVGKNPLEEMDGDHSQGTLPGLVGGAAMAWGSEKQPG